MLDKLFFKDALNLCRVLRVKERVLPCPVPYGTRIEFGRDMKCYLMCFRAGWKLARLYLDMGIKKH